MTRRCGCSRDGEEVDFLVERGPRDYVFVEAKVSSMAAPDVSKFPEARKVLGRPRRQHLSAIKMGRGSCATACR